MDANQVNVDVPAILIRISRSFDPKKSRESLYEGPRGVWKIGDRRHAARYALAVAGASCKRCMSCTNGTPQAQRLKRLARCVLYRSPVGGSSQAAWHRMPCETALSVDRSLITSHRAPRTPFDM